MYYSFRFHIKLIIYKCFVVSIVLNFGKYLFNIWNKKFVGYVVFANICVEFNFIYLYIEIYLYT